MSTKLTAEEIKLRGSLLAKNKELLKLHKDLVFSNVLSEEEFWEDRRGLLRTQEVLLKQKKGLTSALVSDDLKPTTAASADNVKYVLTPTIIQTIFEQHPVLKRAFQELVTCPEPKLAERDFWIEYFKSKFFNESRSSSISGSSLLDPFYQETMKSTDLEYFDESQIKVSNQCDITRSEEDHHVNNYSKYQAAAAAAGSNDSSLNILRQFNKHSLRILQSQKAVDSKRDVNIEISDLNIHTVPEMAMLNVQESVIFSQNTKTEETSSIASEITPKDSKQIVKSLNSAFEATKYQSNYAVGNRQFTSLLERNNYTIEPTSEQQKLQSSATPSLTADQVQLINSCTEILRHFWKTAACSVSSGKINSEKLAKLTRFVTILDRMEGKIDFVGKQNLVETIKFAKLKYQELSGNSNSIGI